MPNKISANHLDLVVILIALYLIGGKTFLTTFQGIKLSFIETHLSFHVQFIGLHTTALVNLASTVLGTKAES